MLYRPRRIARTLSTLFLTVIITSCTVHVGQSSLDVATGISQEESVFGLGLTTGPNVKDNRLEIESTVDVTSLAESEATFFTTSGELPASELDLVDIRAVVRLYPWGYKRAMPFLGAGLGHSRLKVESRGTGGIVECPPGFSFGFTCREILEDDTTLGRVTFPHASIGLLFPLGKQRDDGDITRWFFLEARHDFDKNTAGLDFGGATVLLGFGIKEF